MHVTRVFVLAAVITAASGAQAALLPPAARGAKTVLLQVEPGPLTVTMLKRDLNIYEGEDVLHITLFDPLGNELLKFDMPDDGNAGKGGRAADYQRHEEAVQCSLAGTYRLAVRGAGDAVWGMETSAAGYVVAGEPLFSDGSVSGSVLFSPPDRDFTITLSALHDSGRQVVPLLDADGERLGRFDLAETGEEQTMEFEGAERKGLWRLDFEALDVRLELEHVDHWTCDEQAWFEAGKSRWMLMPYRFTQYLQPGETAEIEFRLRNSTGHPDELDVVVQADDGLEVGIADPAMPVALGDTERATVRLRVTLDEGGAQEEEYHAFLRATAAGEPTAVASSAVNVRVGESPVSQPLNMPIVLRPFQHENVQFGYAPDHMRNEVYFNADNRPFIRQRTESHYGSSGVFVLDPTGEWVERGFEDAIREVYPDYKTSYGGGGFAGAKIAFDGQGGIYTQLRLVLEGGGRPVVLLFSPDEGRSWQVHTLRGNSYDIEQFTGHNALDIPPPVLTYETTAPHEARFCAHNDLWLYLPTRDGDNLEVGDPIKVAENVVGSCQHSGGPASSVTRDGRTHIVWGEVAAEDAPGVPTYVATYDHATGEVGEKVLLGHGPPVNDVHNVPAITMDSAGYLHVLIGAHGNPFHYVRSLAPNDASTWTEPEPILTTGYVGEEGETGRQTYISLVCDADDTLHTAFRQWRKGVDDYHGDSNYAALSVQHRPRGGEWSDAQPLVVAAVPGYSIWYHKLTVDRLGDLWLSYSYWTNDESYQGQFPDRYHHRAVLVSRDGGTSWKLAETEDFIQGVRMLADPGR